MYCTVFGTSVMPWVASPRPPRRTG
jgi:hypothetical protein